MKMPTLFRTAVVLLALLAAAGCATLPSTDVMKVEVAGYTLPRVPQPGMAMVYVVRPDQLGALVRFNVFLDDREDRSEMGYTRGGQHIYFDVTPGDHRLYSKAETWAEIAFSAKPGEVVFIHQEPTMGIIMARNNLSRVDDLRGRYHVKNTEGGTILKAEK